MDRDERRDEGSSTPLILLCFLLAAMLVAGVTAASSAFLAQRDLQAVCDGAAVAATAGVDPAMYREPDPGGDLPLATGPAQDAVENYRAGQGDPTLRLAVTVEGDRATVRCGATRRIPFGRLFGFGDGLERSTVSTARARIRP